MQPTDDSALLRQYAEYHSDEAFATLVTRHVNLVYSVALRHVGNPHNAEEITQAVFVILAKKAAQLHHARALSSWLFQATRLTATNFVRSETRRHRREEEVQMQSILNESGSEVWPRIAPWLDTAVAGLREKDRQAIVLRFYEGRNLREVGLALGASEGAAEKRVNRALEKLRKFFTKRGVSSTTAIIAGAISANSVQAAPVALAKAVTAVALAKGAAASGSILILVKGALKLMAWAKAQTAIVIGTAVLLAAGTTTVVVKDLAKSEAAIATEKLSPEDAYLAAGVFLSGKEPPALMVRTTHFPGNHGMYCYETGKFAFAAGRNVEFTGLLTVAYHFRPARMILPPDVPTTNFDFLATLPDCPNETFQEAIKNTLGWTAHTEMRETNVLLLKVKIADVPGLQTGVTTSQGHRSTCGGDVYHATNMPISDLREFLEDEIIHQPVLDQTGLTNKYDITLDWQWSPDPSRNHDSLKKVLIEQFGLELVPGRERIEMLVVEQAKK
jgi:uncharacterized protein (TIGR03435 family)